MKGKKFEPALVLNNAVANIICALLFDLWFDYEDEEFKKMQAVVAGIFEGLQESIVVCAKLLGPVHTGRGSKSARKVTRKSFDLASNVA